MNMIDNLTEAISHAREKAEEQKKKAESNIIETTKEGWIRVYDGKEYNACLECASEHEQLAEWLEELKARREADRWIPVSERLPEDFCVVLVYCPQFDNIYRVFRESDAWHQFCTSDVLMQAVTHWRPLPKAPESEEK